MDYGSRANTVCFIFWDLALLNFWDLALYVDRSFIQRALCIHVGLFHFHHIIEMEQFWKKRKKNILVLPFGSQIPKEKLKKILKNYDVYVDESVTDSTTGSGDHGNNLLTSTDKGKETMKKSKTLLFIPSFRKRKKSAKYHAVPTDVNQIQAELGDTSLIGCDVSHPAGRSVPPANPLRSCDSDSGRDSDSVGSGPSDSASIRSSSSSLEGLATSQRSSSLDSGIDSLTPRATTMLPESQPVVIRGNSDGSSCPKGRAPIASPEDDSLLVPIEEEEETATSTSAVSPVTLNCDNSVTFGTISDCSSSCSCDSCDSTSEDDSPPRNSPYASDSDSDLENSNYHGNRKTDSVSSDSDSDSDFDQCSDIFSTTKCSTSQPQRNSWHSSIVHRQIVNSGRTLRKVFSRAKIKTNGSVKHIKNSSSMSSSVHVISKPQSSTPSVSSGNSSFSEFLLDHERTLRTGQASEGVTKLSDSLCDRLPSASSKTFTRTHSVADKNFKPLVSVRRSHSFQGRPQRPSPPLPERPQRPTPPQSSATPSVLDSTIPDICASTNKSPAEVRKSLQKTAFWVENNAYDKKTDLSPPPIHSKSSVSERDLCREIIGIYFGEDSDSSLSSSCLDSSVDRVSPTPPTEDHMTSPPRTLETNLDDFTTATYVPAPYATSKATTRKISNASTGKTSLTHGQSVIVSNQIHHLDQTEPTQLQAASQPTPNSSEDSKPVAFLSEHEVDTITKFHTLCNGQRIVKYLNMSESPMIHFPPPKSASRISWHQKLEDCHFDPHSPRVTPTKPKSALRLRPKDFQFPYVEDKPSPIVVTRLRRSKSLSRSRDWPW